MKIKKKKIFFNFIDLLTHTDECNKIREKNSKKSKNEIQYYLKSVKYRQR